MKTAPDGGSSGLVTLVSSSGEECAPITDIFNTATSTDWIFFSVANNSNRCAGSSGCIMSLNLTTVSSWPPSGVTNAVDASGGTSGIIVDNVANTTNYPQASSIYFTWLSNSTSSSGSFSCNGTNGVGCAVKLTQSALQ